MLKWQDGFPFLYMDKVVIIMALTHSSLVSLFIKVGLSIFSPKTSPAKYCYCNKWLYYEMILPENEFSHLKGANKQP